MRYKTLLALAIILPLLATGIAVIAVMYVGADRRSSELAEKLLASVTARGAQEVQARSDEAVHVARGLAALSHNSLELGDSDRLSTQLLGLLRANPGVTWISFSDAAGTFTGVYRDAEARIRVNQSRIQNGKTVLVETYVADDGARTPARSDPDSGYDPRTRDFYRQAAKARDVVWLPPYVFFGQNVPGITCAIAVRSPAGELQGVISVDYDLRTLSALAAQLVTSDHSEVMIFTAEKTLVAHSAARIVTDPGSPKAGQLLTLADTADPPTEVFQRSLDTAALGSGQNGPHYVRFTHAGEPWLACVLPAHLPSGPSEFVATIAPVHDFAPSAWQSSRNSILIVVGALAAAGIIAILLSNGVTRPITTLVAISEKVGKGDLEVPVYLGELREFKQLGNAFQKMLSNLRDWVRIRSSLQIAMEIQQSLLPQKSPIVPGFDIAGYSSYCDETGGDYYDYILLQSGSPHRLFIALGDVMGHGLPSALLMAGARGILRSTVSPHLAVGHLLTRLNALLHHDTGGKRFMTMGIICFDLSTRTCSWASAGHDPPLIYIPIAHDFTEPEGGDMPLAITDDIEYGTYPLEAGPGSIFFLGSDGVWEMFGPAGDQYGKERLKEVIARNQDKSAAEIKEAILQSLNEFRGTTPVKDDVTFVIAKMTND